MFGALRDFSQRYYLFACCILLIFRLGMDGLFTHDGYM
jgi:hypothetical protein